MWFLINYVLITLQGSFMSNAAELWGVSLQPRLIIDHLQSDLCSSVNSGNASVGRQQIKKVKFSVTFFYLEAVKISDWRQSWEMFPNRDISVVFSHFAGASGRISVSDSFCENKQILRQFVMNVFHLILWCLSVFLPWFLAWSSPVWSGGLLKTPHWSSLLD